LALLGLVSALLAALDVRDHPLERRSSPQVPSGDELVQLLCEADLLETTAVLAAIGGLAGDEALRCRARETVTSRTHALPDWLLALSEARPADRAIEVGHVLGDGNNVMIGASLAGGHELTAVVYIDHNMGTLVKNAFVVDQPMSELVGQMRAVADDDDADIVIGDLDSADARARITQAIELSRISWPPLETETWPACRPLVDWMVRMLPGGGTGYQRPEWGEAAIEEMADRFLRSPFGAGFAGSEYHELLGSLLHFGTDYGPGDPMRWSPVVVEILLTDWIPRKIVAEASYLAMAPDLLRAFIRFCHHERGLRSALTEQTLAAVDQFEPQYQQLIRTPRPQGPQALLAAMKDLNPDGPWPSPPRNAGPRANRHRRKRGASGELDW
jgi:hypothetical protein